MTEEIKKPRKKKEINEKVETLEDKTNSEVHQDKTNSEVSQDKSEKSKEPKKKVEIVKKEEAVAYGVSAPLSKKHSMYICSFIKFKPIDQAINELQEVLKYKRAIPFKGETPHRHELGGKPGRYPQNASRYFINLLKGLKGNALVNGLDLDRTKIFLASASWDSRPTRSGGRAAKRSYIILKAKEFTGGKQ